MNLWLQRGLVVAMWGCLILAVSAVTLDAGVAATPWNTRDSRGATMEFNDRFSAEHYSIALSNLRPWQLLKPRYVYDWAQWGMILLGVRFFTSKERRVRTVTLIFFFAQSGLFFLGWLQLVFLNWPQIILRLIRCEATREDFVDVPFTWLASQPPWVVVSLLVGAVLYGCRSRQLPSNDGAVATGLQA